MQHLLIYSSNSKIYSKNVATRGAKQPTNALFLPPNAPKYACRPGSARSHWGAYSAPPDPLTASRGGGPGREGEGEGTREKGERREARKARRGKGRGSERDKGLVPHIL